MTTGRVIAAAARSKRTRTQCAHEVGEPPGYWHLHRCNRKSKFVATLGDLEVVLCTQHSKDLDYREFEIRPL